MWFKKNNPPPEASFSVDKRRIKRLATLTALVVRDAQKPELRRARVKVEAGTMQVMVSDGCRILGVGCLVEPPVPAGFSLVIALGTLEKWSTLALDQGWGTGRISVGGNVIAYDFGEVNFSETYEPADALPDYERFFPTSRGEVVGVDRGRMVQALERLTSRADAGRRIKIYIQDRRMTILSLDGSPGEAETLDVDYGKSPVTLFFNVDYLADLFKNIATESWVNLKIMDMDCSARSLFVRAEGYTYYLLPMAG